MELQKTDEELHTTFSEERKGGYKKKLFIFLQDKLMAGLKLTLDSTYNPDTGNKNGKLKAEMKTNSALMTLDTDLNLGGPIFNTSAVLGHKVRLCLNKQAQNSAFDRADLSEM